MCIDCKWHHQSTTQELKRCQEGEHWHESTLPGAELYGRRADISKRKQQPWGGEHTGLSVNKETVPPMKKSFASVCHKHMISHTLRGTTSGPRGFCNSYLSDGSIMWPRMNKATSVWTLAKEKKQHGQPALKMDWALRRNLIAIGSTCSLKAAKELILRIYSGFDFRHKLLVNNFSKTCRPWNF